MKKNNPMTVKINQAIAKMRMKVRNKVQLPDKLPLAGPNNAKSKRKQGRSVITGNKAGPGIAGQAGAAPLLKDWQTSINSTRSSQGYPYNL